MIADTNDVTFVIGFSIGGAVIVALIGLLVRAWVKKNDREGQ